MTQLIIHGIREPSTERRRKEEAAVTAEPRSDAADAQKPAKAPDRREEAVFSLYVELL